jgi:GT2 family glycosyltransferase
MTSDVLEQGCDLTIFALPKPFRGHIGVIQTNAVQSWKHLDTAREVILIGGDDGIADVARNVGAIHREAVLTDAFGTPLLDDAFRIARCSASAGWLCYVNSDIILMPEFSRVVSEASRTLGECLVVSRRWNLDVREPLDFGPGWQGRLRERARVGAEVFTSYGIDVFAFPKSLVAEMPPFSVGRPYWDNWMIAEARRRGVPVVDATLPYGVIHQNHEALIPDSVIRRGQQGLRNFWLAGDSLLGLGHTGDATHCVRDGAIRPVDTIAVSVVIPHAGTFPQIRGCLRALSEQSYPRTFVEIIVVENSEQAVTAPVLLEFPLVRFTRETKPGPAAARNKGASLARGDLIAFLDSDCRPAGNWIERGVETARAAGMQSIVACNIVPTDPGYGSSGVKRYEALAYHDQKGYVEHCQACITGGMFVPKSVWVSVGPFDEQFPEAACEDWEWSTRASSRGVRIVYGDRAVVGHPVHCTWGDLRKKALRQARGEILLARHRRRYTDLDPVFQLRFWTRRLINELKRIVLRGLVPWYSRPAAATAALFVWFWSVTESRRQLSRLARELTGTFRPRRARRLPPIARLAPPAAEHAGSASHAHTAGSPTGSRAGRPTGRG